MKAIQMLKLGEKWPIILYNPEQLVLELEVEIEVLTFPEPGLVGRPTLRSRTGGAGGGLL